jgi:hypothetical protein
MGLEDMCRKWLEQFGYFEVTVTIKRVLERSDLDLALGLIGVEFDFFNNQGWVGDAIAFFRAEEVHLGGAAMYPQKVKAET